VPASGRSLRVTVTLGADPNSAELVSLKKLSRWSTVALSVYAFHAPTRLPPNDRWLCDAASRLVL
jgi:hypothetical protein